MTIYVKIITLAAILVALASGAPLQAQTPEIDALRAGAEQGDASAQSSLGIMYDYGGGVSEDDAVVVRWSPTKGMPARSTASGPCTPPAAVSCRITSKHTCGGILQRRDRPGKTASCRSRPATPWQTS